MKEKLIYILLSPLTIILLILMLYGRDESESKTCLECRSGKLWVDTINIHEKSHEVLFWSTRNGNAASIGGMIHSPECWCLNKSYEDEENKKD